MNVSFRVANGIMAALRGTSSATSMFKNVLIRMAVLLLNFGTGALVARSLGPSGRGEQAVIALWPGFIATILTLGIPTALNYHSRKNPEGALRLYMSSAIAVLGVGVTASAIGAALLPLLLHGYDARTIHVAQLFMLFAPETLVASVARAHLESRGQFSRSTLGLFYPNVVTLLSLVVLVEFKHLTPATAALCYMVPVAIQSTWIISRLWDFERFAPRRLAQDLRLLLPYGLQCWGLDIINAVSGQMDLVIIVAFLTPKELGLYAVALSVSRIINIIPTSIVLVLFPRASGMAERDAINLVTRAVRLSATVCTIAGIAFYMVLRFAVPLVYGPAFSAAIPLLGLLISEAVLGGMVTVLLQAFMSTGRPLIVTTVQIVWTVSAVILLFVLVPRMNIAGAATALLLAALVRLSLVLLAYSRVLGRPIPSLIVNKADLTMIVEKAGNVGFMRR